jgi:hypothetical protein
MDDGVMSLLNQIFQYRKPRLGREHVIFFRIMEDGSVETPFHGFQVVVADGEVLVNLFFPGKRDSQPFARLTRFGLFFRTVADAFTPVRFHTLFLDGTGQKCFVCSGDRPVSFSQIASQAVRFS